MSWPTWTDDEELIEAWKEALRNGEMRPYYEWYNERTHDDAPRPDAAPGLPAEGTVGSLYTEETEED